jgi:hypothetical protein
VGIAHLACELTPSRRSRHSRCKASAFLELRTAAEGGLRLPLLGGGERRMRNWLHMHADFRVDSPH